MLRHRSGINWLCGKCGEKVDYTVGTGEIIRTNQETYGNWHSISHEYCPSCGEKVDRRYETCCPICKTECRYEGRIFYCDSCGQTRDIRITAGCEFDIAVKLINDNAPRILDSLLKDVPHQFVDDKVLFINKDTLDWTTLGKSVWGNNLITLYAYIRHGIYGITGRDQFEYAEKICADFGLDLFNALQPKKG